MNKKCKCSNIFEDQKEFMVACDQSINPLDFEGDNYNEWHLWLKLINEEHSELIEAALQYADTGLGIADGEVRVVSEAIDLIYVTIGLLNNMGVDGKKVFDAIHDANMKKVMVNGKVQKNEFGKVLKPEGWKKANIAEVLTDG